jgi:hypothetical protein
LGKGSIEYKYFQDDSLDLAKNYGMSWSEDEEILAIKLSTRMPRSDVALIGRGFMQ